MTERAMLNKLFIGVSPAKENKVSIIQYANDTIFFCKAKMKELRNLKFVWQLFEWASGLKINRNKTELLHLGSRASRGTRLAELIGCKLGQFSIKYLGLLVSNKRVRKEDWWTDINKFRNRIEGWQAKLLSQGGRLILVNSVLTSLPLYFLSVFRASKWVISRMEAPRRAFFWKGGASVLGGQCLVQWKQVCRSKKKGGLGVLDLKNMNIGLLTKWWWKLMSGQNFLWDKLIFKLYYIRRRPHWEGASFTPYAQWWKSVLGSKEVFKCGVHFALGDGKIMELWRDK